MEGEIIGGWQGALVAIAIIGFVLAGLKWG